MMRQADDAVFAPPITIIVEPLIAQIHGFLRADFAVYETYLYSIEPPLNCPISAFGGLQDNKVSDSDLEAWRAQTNVSFSLRMFPGDHFFLKQPLLLRSLVQELQ